MKFTSPQAGLLISGDANHLHLKSLLEIDFSLKQTVKFPTRKDSILDIVVTNLADYNYIPERVPPLLPDDPTHAEPSDHHGVLVHPLPVSAPVQRKVRINIRRFPNLKINLIGQIIGTEEWSFMSQSFLFTTG